jgi:hypothetical protein
MQGFGACADAGVPAEVKMRPVPGRLGGRRGTRGGMTLAVAAFLLAAAPGFAARGQAMANPGRTSGLIEQVGPLPLNVAPTAPRPAAPPARPRQPDLRSGRAFGPAIRPVTRLPELTRQPQLSTPDASESQHSIAQEQGVAAPTRRATSVTV